MIMKCIEINELGLCSIGTCSFCDTIRPSHLLDFPTYYNEKCLLVSTIFVSPSLDYISYWKTPEGILQLLEGLFEPLLNLDLGDTQIYLNFGFTPTEGYSIPLLTFNLLMIKEGGHCEGLEEVLEHFDEVSPRIFGILSDTEFVSENTYQYLIKLGHDKTQIPRLKGGGKGLLSRSEVRFLNNISQDNFKISWSELKTLRESRLTSDLHINYMISIL